MAYIQEQQRLAREEKKKRELEIQKRKLKSINVANPTSSSLSFDELVTIKPSSPKSSPKVTRQVHDVTVSKVTSTTVTSQQHHTTSGGVDPLPTQSSPIPTTMLTDSSQLVQATTAMSSGDQNGSVPSAKQPDNTFEKLMESSLTNLKDTSPGRSRKMDFKSSSSGPKPSPLASAQKTFSQSTKARAWTGDSGVFSGVFSQHLPQLAPDLQGDDSFGDFQSVGTGPDTTNTLLIEPTTHSQVEPIVGLQNLHPVQQGFQGQPQSSSQQTQLRGASVPVHGSNTIPTSSYQHPIPSASVTQKPQSPTGTQFTNLNPNKFPPVYIEVYKHCSKPGEPFLNTDLLFPLLLSSQLPKNVLRDLWSVANREVPGKLNQTELFVLLGLIGLAQVYMRVHVR